jgi:hypothetical protein
VATLFPWRLNDDERILATSVADPECLSRIRIFFYPGSNKKKEQGKIKLVFLPV